MPENSRKIVIITGVSKGIGKSITLEFMKHDWIVIGCARNKKIMNDMNKKYTHHSFTSVDVSDFNAVKSWIDGVITKYGVPDMLINNAAINNYGCHTMDNYRKTMNINLFGSLYTIDVLLPKMKKSNKNIKILNISSVLGLIGSGPSASYCASKFAMEGLTQCIAAELPHNIMICCYDPGVVSSDMCTNAMKFTPQEAVNAGCIDVNDWGKLNYNFMVNILNRNDHNGKHIFGVNVKESYVKFSPPLKPFLSAFETFQSKL